jgi:quinol monooxygenase YgiN
MPVRLVITTHAKPGKGTELAQAMADRCRAVQQEPGCEQFEVFQSALDPDKLVTLELWADQAALDAHAHAQRNATQPPNPALAALRADGVHPREDYLYNRTR